MKKILITGAGSYIGTSFEVYAKAREKDWQIDTVDMLDGSWRGRSFAGYDAVFHVAGIAHRKETAENAHLYYEINRDLAIEVAKKAKADGVGQFVFLSSMSIYGRETGVVTKETSPAPVTNYGKSKLQAEEGILPLADESFTVTVLRPPMVYGDGCRGNYNAIIRIVERFPVFPRVNNRRSMIYVDNLSSFVLMILRERLGGVYFPQDRTYRNTTEIAREVARKMGKKVYMSYLLGFCVLCLKPFSGTVRKAFGSLVYRDTEDFDFRYCAEDQKQ